MHVCFILQLAAEAYEYVGDTRLNELLDDATAYAGDGDYYQAMIAMLNDTVTFYQEGNRIILLYMMPIRESIGMYLAVMCGCWI